MKVTPADESKIYTIADVFNETVGSLGLGDENARKLENIFNLDNEKGLAEAINSIERTAGEEVDEADVGKAKALMGENLNALYEISRSLEGETREKYMIAFNTMVEGFREFDEKYPTEDNSLRVNIADLKKKEAPAGFITRDAQELENFKAALAEKIANRNKKPAEAAEEQVEEPAEEPVQEHPEFMGIGEAQDYSRLPVSEVNTNKIGPNLYLNYIEIEALNGKGSPEYTRLHDTILSYRDAPRSPESTQALFDASWNYLRLKDTKPWSTEGQKRVNAAAKVMAQAAIDILMDPPRGFDTNAFEKKVKTEALRNEAFRETLINELPEIASTMPNAKSLQGYSSAIKLCKFTGAAIQNCSINKKDALVSGKIPTDDSGKYKALQDYISKIDDAIYKNSKVIEEGMKKGPDGIRNFFQAKRPERENEPILPAAKKGEMEYMGERVEYKNQPQGMGMGK